MLHHLLSDARQPIRIYIFLANHVLDGKIVVWQGCYPSLTSCIQLGCPENISVYFFYFIFFCLNVFIANTKQGVGPQVFPTLVTALPLQYTYKALHRQWRKYLSRDMRFPTMRSVRPAKAQTSLGIRAV